jgi:phosphatidylserine/phosphatidylglycerophosphate/cardiolipin synthase-like enzyme
MKALGAFFFCFALAWPALADDAPAEVHYSPDEDLEAIDVAEIARATETIAVAAFVMTDRAVVEALRAAGARGVEVRIWRDGVMAEKLSVPDVAALLGDQHPNVVLRTKGPGAFMHLKGYCIDGRLLRTGSANFSRSGLTEQDNDLVILHSEADCQKFEAKFDRAWGKD